MENNLETPEKSKRSAHGSMWTISVVVLVVVLGAIVFFNKGVTPAAQNETQKKTENTSESGSSESTSGSVEKTNTDELKVFTVDGENFSFSPKEIRVKKGDMVKIVFNNKAGFHDLVIDEYSVRTPQIQAGKSAEFTFTADKTGTFEYYCSVGSHRAMGMKGNLIVE